MEETGDTGLPFECESKRFQDLSQSASSPSAVPSNCSQQHLNAMDSTVQIQRAKSSSTNYGRRHYQMSVVWVGLLAFLGAILSNNNPLLLVEASGTRAPAVPMTRMPQPTMPTIFYKPSIAPHPFYSWGNLGHVPEKVPLLARIEAHIGRLVQSLIERVKLEWKIFLSELTVGKCFRFFLRCARSWVFWYFSRDCLVSIYEDQWHAERDPDKFFGSQGMWITQGAHKDVVKRRIQRSRRNRQWVGLGYTPRLVWLVGVLLRGTFQCTAIPKVFNPSLTGWGAGTILGAKCTHQEWIAAFMIGWFGSEHYWRYIFGCNGPPFAEPGFSGIPVFITKVRDVRPI